MKKNLTAGVLAASFALPAMLTGCGSAEVRGTDLMEDITPAAAEQNIEPEEYHADITDFSLRLFRAAAQEENPLISPVSVLTALGMQANGAENETLAQMEAAFGLDRDTLNQYLRAYNMPPQGKDCQFDIANSVWVTDQEDFTVNPNFLQTAADYYDAQVYSVPFDDGTLKDINRWVRKHTHDMIPEILEELPPEPVMCLVNALAFEAEWEEPYEKDQVREDIFTHGDGTEIPADFMYSKEGAYIEDEHASGFIKPYKDYLYGFAAILPEEGMTPEEYLASVSGEELYRMLSKPMYTEVQAAVPKFETECSLNMNDILAGMGMEDMFSAAKADLSGLGKSDNGNIYVSQVVHRTFISVDERKTKAGASTAVVYETSCAPMESETVYLTRPFVYMLVDFKTGVPFMIGIMDDIGQA